ncbi:MAG: hypothetical protein ABIJ08_06830 [Nanoarchaeota archaeon]
METEIFTLWSIVHIFAGMAFGFGLSLGVFKGLKNYFNHIIAFGSLVFWEFFEYFVFSSIEFGNELMINRISDVVIGYLAFLGVYLYIKYRSVKNVVGYFIVTLCLFSLLGLLLIYIQYY